MFVTLLVLVFKNRDTVDTGVILQKLNTIQDQSQYLSKLKQLTGCLDRPDNFRITQRRFFWVLENYIKPNKPPPKCHESVTYATHGEFTHLDNLIQLVSRWMAPISVALYCPGTDYQLALVSVIYLRNCLHQSRLIKEFVTFHFYFNRVHLENQILHNISGIEETFYCNIIPPYLKVRPEETFRAKNNLFYYINVGRNIARELATTHFVLSSDIELYPNMGVPQDFLRMYAQLNHTNEQREREVFALPVFEVNSNARMTPTNKTELVDMLKNKTAAVFHESFCRNCHRIPMFEEWKRAPVIDELKIFTTVKRIKEFSFWEPVFIGTNQEPFYENSLTWEEESDRMTQSCILCLLDYDIHVLDNAFLTHRVVENGSRTEKPDKIDGEQLLKKMRELRQDLVMVYGDRKGCQM